MYIYFFTLLFKFIGIYVEGHFIHLFVYKICRSAMQLVFCVFL